MKLEQTFEVQAPLDEVWAALNDLERVAPCLPGAAITDRDEDGTYHGTFQVKLGPMTAAYRGTVQIADADAASHTATLKAKGTDKRGQGGASATIVNVLTEHEGATRVAATTDFTITGRLAAFGRGGMMEDVSNRLLRDFATCLQSRLAGGPATPATPSGAEVTAGDAAPEEVAAAAEPPTRAADAPTQASAATPPPAAPGAVPSSPPPRAEPLKGGSLFLSVLVERIKRLFRRRG
jgi:uncharacterized protein